MNYEARTHRSLYDIPVSRQTYYYGKVSKITTFLGYSQFYDSPKKLKWAVAMNANFREEQNISACIHRYIINKKTV